MSKVIHTFWWVLSFLILVMALTGGWIFNIQGLGKIEFSSLDLWVLIWGILFLVLKAPVPFVGLWERIKSESLKSKSLPVLLGITGLLLTLGHFLKHGAGATDVYDVTFLHQSLFFPYVEGTWLKCDFCLRGTFFGDHISPILILLSPLTMVFKSDLFIFLLQSVILMFGVWILSRDQKQAFFLGFIFLCHRALRGAGIWDFREDDLAFLFFSCALIAAQKSNRPAFILSLVGALLCKENMGIIAAAMAIPFWFNKKRFEAVLSLTLGLMWTLLCFKVFIPYFNQGVEASNNIVVRFPGLGATPSDVVHNLLTSPMVWWNLVNDRLLNREAVKYLILLVGPIAACFSMRSLIWLIPAVPGVAMNLLSASSAQRSLQFHYDLIILPFLFFAARMGWESKLKHKWGVGFVLFWALALSGRWPGFAITQNVAEAWARVPHYWALNKVVAATLPTDVVCVDLKTGAHLSSLPELRQMYRIPAEGQAPRLDRTHLEGHSMSQCTRWILSPDSINGVGDRDWIQKQGLRVVTQNPVFVELLR